MLNRLTTGTICLVRFHPSTGSELKRFRPAVVVSEKISKIDPRFVLIAPFTTSTGSLHQKSELLIKKGEVLEKDSVLLCWYLKTIDVNRIETILGKLSQKEIEQMSQTIKQLF